MKGHSIPGIKGCKITTLEDGRAASSAFQMQSPLHGADEEMETDLTFVDPLAAENTANKSNTQEEGQGGVNYALQQFQKMMARIKAKKEAKKNPAEKLDNKTTEYDVTGDGVDTTDPNFQSPIGDQFKTDEKANIEKEINENLSEHVVNSDLSISEVKPTDYSGASKNDMTSKRREIKDSGEDFDPENNPEHAEIQNKINELYGSSTRY